MNFVEPSPLPAVIPDLLTDRVRQLVPEACGVVAGSTPVLSFGDATRAYVATVGINPSRREFADAEGRPLRDASRRFETLESLQVPSLADASDETVFRVIQGCNGYFARNPYTKWFNPLDRVLRHSGPSYYDGSACHLDLVQWATNPVWGGLSVRVQQRLLETDVPFLDQQLRSSPLQLVLLNGRTVIDWFTTALGASLEQAAIEVTDSVVVRFSTGRISQGQAVVGWSTNLQSSFGVTTAHRDGISAQVRSLVERLAPSVLAGGGPAV